MAVRECRRAHCGRFPPHDEEPVLTALGGHEEVFYATKQAALGAIQGRRCVKGTKTLPIEPLTIKEVRKALEGRKARRRAKAKP